MSTLNTRTHRRTDGRTGKTRNMLPIRTAA